MQRCATASDCLEPTVFDYQDGAAGWASSDSAVSGLTLSSIAYAMPGDANGDGFEDLFFFDTSIAKWDVVWGGASGFGLVVSTGYGSATYQFQALPIDLDSDGKRDLLVPNGANWWWLRLDANGNWQFSDTGAPADGASGSAWVVDMDGDSREDVVWGWNSRQIRWRKNTSSGGSGSLDSTYTTAWTGGQFEFFNTNPFGTTAKTFRQISRVADFNGDNRGDLIVSMKYDTCEGEPPGFPGEPNPCPIWQYYKLVLYGTSAGFSTGDQINVGPTFEVNAADFNADGLSDLYWYQGSSWRIRFSTGTGFLPEHNTTRPSNYQETVGTDWDSDGRTDLLSRNTSTGNWDVLRSTGETLLAATNTGTPATGSAASPKIADVDGNGLADLVYLGASNSVRFRAHNATRPDLLDIARDGFGAEVNFDYAPLTDSSVHTKLSGSQFPTREYQGSLHVVKQYTASTGVASPTTYTMSYSYEGARVHAQGRGLLGFAKRKMTDNRNGVFTEESFSQLAAEYAWIGMPTSIVVKQSAAGNVIRQTTNTLAKHIYGSGTTERRFPYVSQSVVNDHEIEGPYNGTQFRSATTTTTIGSSDYGSATSVSTTVTEIATGLSPNATHTETTSVTLLAPDVNNWCVGRADQTQSINSHSHSWGTQITRTFDYEWDTTKCRLTKEIIEPASSQWKVTTEFDFDDDPGEGAGFGNLASIKVTPVGEAPRQTSFAWTGDGRFLQSTTNPLGHVSSNTWIASLGLIDTITDPNGLVLNYDYDGYGRRTRDLRPDGTATRWSFGACMSPSYCGESVLRSYVHETIRDTADAIVSDRYVYRDMFEREKYEESRTLNGSFSVVHSVYDSLGRLATRSLPYISGSSDPYKVVTYTYDLLNRVKKEEREVSEADPSLQSRQWTYAGLSITESDALSRSTTKKFTAIGQVAQVIDSGGNDTDYEFDAIGNLLKTRDVSGNEVSLGYNVRGFKMSQTDPDFGSWTYDYFPLGELKSQTDAKTPPQSVQFTYDKLSRPLTRIEQEGTTNWTWGTSAASKNIGQLEQVTSPGGYSETFWFDSVGRPIQTSIVADGSTYTLNQSYNASTGFLETLTYPTSTSGVRFKLKYAYQNGHLKTVHDYTGDVQTTKFWEAISTNARGMVFDEEFGSGLKTYSTYDHITGLLMDRETGPSGGSAVQNLNYGYHKDGSLHWRADENQSISEGFYYDSLGRLDYTTGVSSLDLSYYAIGNISHKNDVGTYSYDATKKHAVTAAGSQSFGYDANGNMTPRNGASVSWTSYNLPSVINQTGGNSSTFLYGANRQRYKQVNVEGSTTTTTIYVGSLLERVTVGSVTDWKHYVQASTGEVAVHIRSSSGANSTYYLLKDHLGSTDRIANSSGSVVVALSYDAFGKRRGSNWTGSPSSGDWANIAAITRRGFTGHEHLDNLALIHMNGRVYDPALARFLSADPLIPGAFFSQSFDRYGYVWNNPASFVDPSGFSPDELYDFDSPDGGRRRDCDAFCRALDRMLREFVASTREMRREFPSYLFLEPEPGAPYELADLCSWSLCPTGGFNPIVSSRAGAPSMASGAGGAGCDWNPSCALMSSAGTDAIGSRNIPWGVISQIARKSWASANTVIGLAYGGVGHIAGHVMGTNPRIGVGNNAIQFTNNPFTATATTLGNVILYNPSPLYHPDAIQPSGYTLGYEEMQHTLQAEALGPLYLPAHLVLGTGAAVFNGSWHGPFNILESGPHTQNPRPWP